MVYEVLLLELDFLLLNYLPAFYYCFRGCVSFVDVDFPAIFLQKLPILLRILSISLLVLHAVVHFQSQLLFVLQIDQIFLQKLAEGAVNCILRGGSLGVLAEVCVV